MRKLTLKQVTPFLILCAIAIAAMFIAPAADYVPGEKGIQYNNADIAWVLVASALVFLMTPSGLHSSMAAWFIGKT